MSKTKTTNTFSEGMIKDLNPLNTPATVLTDALNATYITYNGDEFVLQNDMGNCKVEKARLSVGFIPVGMKEYGGIIYVASYNPETKESEIGSFPSPERDFSTNDFENIAPVKFQTSQFTVATTETTAEKTSIIGKLIEPEILQLSPGDMYLVTFNPNGGPSDGYIPLPAYISENEEDRKLFRLKFYKITDENNLTDLDPEDVKLIQDQPNIDDEYVPFNSNSSGTIAVGLELETLDYFDINVIDTSRRTDQQKSAVIEAIGFSNSLADFKGIKVNVTEPTVESFFIEKVGVGKKVSAKLGGLLADSKFVGTAIPYSDYALYPKLKKDFNLEMGKYSSTNGGINNIFKYRVDNNFIKVDFDFKFQGDSSNGLQVYVEFYDPWSDYSIVKVVDDPTYYGINTIQLELVDEPTTTVFNDIDTGGTPTVTLFENPDVNFQKTLLNSTGLIRKTTTLRKNHFYIVRISGVDITYYGNTPVYKHYDFYKGLYTNDLLNNLYDQQNSILETDVNYISDFNKVDFKIKDLVNYDTTIVDSKPTYIKSQVINVDDGAITDDPNYYKTYTNPISGGNIKAGNEWKREVTTDIDFNLNTKKYIFGTFKTDIAEVNIPNLDPSLGPVDSNLVPTVEDLGWTSAQPQIDTNSEAKIEVTKMTDFKYKIKKSLTTNRWVYGDKFLYDNPADPIRKYTVSNLRVDENFKDILTGRTLEIDANGYWFGSPFLYTSTCLANRFAPDKARDLINGTAIKSVGYFARLTSIFATDINNTCQNGSFLVNPRFIIRWDDGQRWDGQEIMMIRGTNGLYPTQITSDSRALLQQAVPEFRVFSQTSVAAYVYYPVNIVYNEAVITNALFKNLYYETKFKATGKTYLSRFLFKAQNNTLDFSTQNINAYINARKSDSVIIDDKFEINDGFIPYIDEDVSIKYNLADTVLSISESASANIITDFEEASTEWTKDATLKPSTKYTHGQLYSLKNEFDYVAEIFKVKLLSSGVPLTPTNFEIIAANEANYTTGGWRAVHYKRDFKVVGATQGPNVPRYNIKLN